MKKVFSIIKQENETLNIKTFAIDIAKTSKVYNIIRHLIKKDYKLNYQIENSFELSFPFSDHTDFENIKSYSKIFNDKMKDFALTDRPIDVIVDIESSFRSKISLPKLSGKALITSYNNELEKQFGIWVKNYTIIEKKSLNNKKGYDFDLLFINNRSLKLILDIFNLSKLKLESCTYLPSILPNISVMSNMKNIGIVMDEKSSYLYIFKKGKIEDYKVVKVGFENILINVATKFEINPNDAKNFCIENIANSTLRKVIYSTIKKLFDEVYISLFSEHEKHIQDYTPTYDKLFIHCLNGLNKEILSVVPVKLRNTMEMYNQDHNFTDQFFIDAFYNYQKHFEILPLKVKYEEK